MVTAHMTRILTSNNLIKFNNINNNNKPIINFINRAIRKRICKPDYY